MVPDTLKTCRLCFETKPILKYYRHKNTKDGFRSECIECCNKVSSDYSRNNPDKVKEIKRKAWYKHGYGITPELVDNLKIKQKNKCWICRENVPLEVDHNHDTGKIRGLLCTKCNKALGLFKDKISNLIRAVLYLWKVS